MKKFYYISYLTPLGPGATFVGMEDHPLSKRGMSMFQTDIGHKASLKTQVLVRPEEVFLQSFIELPEEVAKERFPRDFPVRSLTLFQLADGTKARGDVAKGILIDAPFGPIPDDALELGAP